MSDVINLFAETNQEFARTKCKIWTRGMGYYRPIENFNIGKQSEYKERSFFQESVAMSSAECMKNAEKMAA